MREHRLTSILRRIYGPARTDMDDGSALESDLLLRYRKLHPRNRRWLTLLNPFNRAVRSGLVALAACLLVVSACTIDITTEVELGKQVTMNLETDTTAASLYIHRFILVIRGRPAETQKEISEVLTTEPGVQDVSVSVEDEGERNVNIHILIFGSDLDGEKLVGTLTDSIPDLSRAAVTIDDLRTRFSESLASWVGHNVFGLQGSRPDPQQLRHKVLEEMAPGK